jgi:hypothetical protein
MTTPSGTISMQDIRNETGATGAVSFNDWFVRHVAKTATGAISMSSMRGKTCYPGNSSMLGINYVNTESYFDPTSPDPNLSSFYNLNPDGKAFARMQHDTTALLGTVEQAGGFIDSYQMGGPLNGQPSRWYRATYKGPNASGGSYYGVRRVVG